MQIRTLCNMVVLIYSQSPHAAPGSEGSKVLNVAKHFLLVQRNQNLQVVHVCSTLRARRDQRPLSSGVQQVTNKAFLDLRSLNQPGFSVASPPISLILIVCVEAAGWTWLLLSRRFSVQISSYK